MNQNRTPGRDTWALGVRFAAAAVVLYWLMQTVVAYIKGGPDAPSVGLLIASIVVLGGGAVLVIVLALKAWKIEKAMNEAEEELPEDEAVFEEEEDVSEEEEDA